MANEFLDVEHPVYAANKEHWLKLELRVRGSREVLDELVRWQWETEGGDHYRARKNQATYINFADTFLNIMVGHLFKEAPAPGGGLNFGALGEVRREIQGEPTFAELVYYNVDGVGSDGSEWDAWWKNQTRLAGVCGHRWTFCEAPKATQEGGTVTVADVQRGLRPYLVGLSPLMCPNWDIESGRLNMVLIRFWKRNLRIAEGGKLEGNNPEKHYLLLCREGWNGFGEQYAGRWTVFNEKREAGESGTWTKTGGEIPVAPLYYERDESPEGIADTTGSRQLRPVHPVMSRSAVEALTQVAVSYMNLSSAADFDAIDAASSLIFMLGVSKEAFNLADEKMKEGSKNIPLPPAADGTVPAIVDGSTGAVTADVFETRLSRKEAEAKFLGALEASGTPDASGVSKEMGFMDAKSPRLANMAAELQTTQNSMLRFLELRFGVANPQSARASVRWPREFNLKPIVDDIEEHLNLQTLTGIVSPTLTGKLMTQAAKERGFLEDDETAKKVQAEYTEAVTANEEAKQAERDRQAEVESGGF